MSFTSPHWPSELLRIVLIAGYVVVAAIVSANVLLRKRDVRAALGWIALAWLSPFLGAVVYVMFGVNRVTRRAVRLYRSEELPSPQPGRAAEPTASPNIAVLSAVSERVTGDPLLAGNAITVLHGGDEAYPAMLDAIGSARRSVAMASYIFRNDASGRAFADALIAARRRGVDVRVLLDGIGSGYFRSAVMRHLRAGGVAAARFMHTYLPWRMPFINMRNHKKLLVVDGSVGFTGGLNIGDEYSASASAEHHVDDIHVRVEGPIVARLMDNFARDWSFTTDEALVPELWWPPQAVAGNVFARGISSGPDADLYKVEVVLGAALAQAQSRVRIVTPYFLPDQSLQFAIAQAGLRGVPIDIVIPEHCDYAFLDWAMRAHLRFFRDVPVTIWLSPRPFDHAKLMTVDGKWCLIGSSNWDARSLRLNFEFDLECYDAAFAAEIDALIDRKIAQGRILMADELMAAPKWVQLRDAATRLFQPYL